MAYNYRSIESFLEKVNREAREAAQAVYDKYEPEFLKRVQAQISDKDTVSHAMGTCSIMRISDGIARNEVGENLAIVLSSHQYNRVKARMDLPYKFTKTEVIKNV